MVTLQKMVYLEFRNTRWFKYDRDCLCVNLATSVPVIFEPPCIVIEVTRYFSLSLLASNSKIHNLSNKSPLDYF